jgi:putative FmdB family regulatory protein
MPIYEYKCLECAAHFEKMQKFSDAPPENCPKCGGKVEKQISLSGFQFKGGGWYVTDYSNRGKSEDKGEATKKDTSGEKASEAKSTTSPESASKPKDEAKKESSSKEKKS